MEVLKAIAAGVAVLGAVVVIREVILITLGVLGFDKEMWGDER